MQTTKFVRKPFYVDAVRVTSANIAEVAKWCGGAVRQAKPDGDVQQGRVPQKYVEVPVYRPMNDRQKMAFVGDWVLFAGKGYKVYTNPAFEKTFTGVSVDVPQEVIDRVSNRDSRTGEFVTKEYADANPDTTQSETIHTAVTPNRPVETPPNHGTTHLPAGQKEGAVLHVEEVPAENTGTTKTVLEP